MPWIKRNLALVISAAIAVGLLGFGGWYLWSALKKNSEIDGELGQAKEDLNRLMNEKPFPSSTNISQARRELERANAFLADARKQFPADPPPTQPLNNLSFKVLLQTSVDELNQLAVASGVKVETNYYYSFEAQRLPVNFAPESLRPLVDRLNDVKAVASLLIKAKINRLEAVRRAAVEGETLTGTDYLSEKPRVHPEAGVVMWPYEFTFQAFSPELAVVMEHLAAAPEAWVVRAVAAEPAEFVKAPERVPVTNQVRRAAGPAPLQTVLEERALRIVLKVDVIKSSTNSPAAK